MSQMAHSGRLGERARHQPRTEVEQLGLVAGFGQRRLVHVLGDVEVGSSTHTGGDKPNQGETDALAQLGTRCIRLSTSAPTSSSRRHPWASCNGPPSKIPMEPMCIGV